MPEPGGLALMGMGSFALLLCTYLKARKALTLSSP
jgi:hypothetical protein